MYGVSFSIIVVGPVMAQSPDLCGFGARSVVSPLMGCKDDLERYLSKFTTARFKRAGRGDVEMNAGKWSRLFVGPIFSYSFFIVFFLLYSLSAFLRSGWYEYGLLDTSIPQAYSGGAGSGHPLCGAMAEVSIEAASYDLVIREEGDSQGLYEQLLEEQRKDGRFQLILVGYDDEGQRGYLLALGGDGCESADTSIDLLAAALAEEGARSSCSGSPTWSVGGGSTYVLPGDLPPSLDSSQDGQLLIGELVCFSRLV